jgi:methyl-accepting chemotaxis protein
MNQLTHSVMGATQEQSRGSEQIVRAVESISAIAQEVASATREQREAGARGITAVESISRLSREVDRKSQDLAEAVSYFKVASPSMSLSVPAAGKPSAHS